MEFIKFKIKNFKGIKEVTIDLSRTPRSRVYTLVGLNESGKTTILEALSNMGGKPYDLKKTDPSRNSLSATDYQSFIPVSERYNFNGTINLTSHLQFDATDKVKIAKFLLDQMNYKLENLQDTFSITKTITYKDSAFEKVNNVWNLIPSVKRPRGRSIIRLGESTTHQDWLKLVQYVQTLIPKVLYFKNEVFDFPHKIFLTDSERRKGQISYAVNQFYCEVIQDVLHAIDPSLSLQKHLITRKNSPTNGDKQTLAGLLQKIGSHITQTIMRQWETIFNRPLRDKRIQAICEAEPNGQIYLQLRLEDGGELFDITERSTGFQWFFVFILLTQYRGYRNESAIFLYDEPASNLHSAAQQQLINCFAKLPEQFMALYSTHSHYLINPDWLDSTLVVRNEAVTADDTVDFDSAKTDIKLLPYRTFVAQNPSGLSYFQPILDVLHYVPSKLELLKPPLLVEGKSDFYALSYLTKVCESIALPFDVIPCLGSGTLDQLIALYAGWGKEFIVLLDSDKAGKTEQVRYEKKFGSLIHGRLFTYGNIDAKWDGYGIEKIIGKSDLLLIQQTVFPEKNYKKDLANLAIQELNAKKQPVKLTPLLKERVQTLVTYLTKQLVKKSGN
jgi:predicted ATP-dependent endonuclease of OLD family